MALTPLLTPLTLPEGTEFPGTPQLLLSLIAAYVEITGFEDVAGVNFGPTTPSEADRDKPWYKTDESYNPIGWYNWNGSTWATILNTLPSGTTANRPVSATTGQQYFDTTINCALVYERSQWRTLAGSPGDCKFVNATSISAAITANPGWVEDTAVQNRVIAGVSTTHEINATLGEETHTMTSGEIAPHTHAVNIKSDPTGGDYNASGSEPTRVTGGAGFTTSSTGSATPFNVMQPTIYRFALIKE